MNSINQVIQKMDAIVDQCKDQNLRAGYFAVLYRYVTIRIKEGIERGEFDDNERMELLDTIFAQRFFDAFNSCYNSSGEKVTKSWQHSFDSSDIPDYIVMQHLLLGINAHINLDLGIAAAETMKGKDLNLIRDDYNRVNAILSSLIDDVKGNIGKISLFFGPLIGLAKNRDEMLVSFSIVVARDGAWMFANQYAVAENKALAIENRDAKIAEIAKCLTDTGPRLSFLIKLIRWGEFRSLKSNLDRLSGIVS